MKRLLFLVVVVLVVVYAVAEGTEARRDEMSVEQLDQFIELLGAIRTSEIGISLSEEQLEQVDIAVAELRSQRTKIPSGGVYKLPTPEETVKNLKIFKGSQEWKKLSESERQELDEVISEMENKSQIMKHESFDGCVHEERLRSNADATAQPFHTTTNAPVRRTIRFIPKNRGGR